MEPIKLEIFMDDKTRAGIQSANGNINGLEKQMQEVISILKKELTGLQDAFKNALSQGISTPKDLADIQALKGKIIELEEELANLKRKAETPVKPVKIDLTSYLDDEIRKIENDGARLKAIIVKIQAERDALISSSVQSASNGIIDPEEQVRIKQLESEIRALTEQLNKYEQAKRQTNETPILKNDPEPKLNSVKMSMAQIARELPSLAMGPQMFFLAISNNIPIFTDAVASARKEHDLLVASGQKATPVWKQLVKSLFSFNTFMAAGITLSVVYGKEIGEWISRLVKGRKAALSMSEAQEKLNESFGKNAGDLAKQIVTIRSLQERWEKLGDNLNEKKKFVTENKKEFEKLGVSINNVGDAENALVTNTESFIQAMYLRAEAAAAFRLASEEAEKALRAQTEIDKKEKEGPNWKDKVKSFLFYDPQWMPGSLSNKYNAPAPEISNRLDIMSLEGQRDQAEADAKAYTETYNEKLLEAAKKLKGAGIKEFHGKINSSGKSATDYQNELDDARIRAQQNVEKARIAVMLSGITQRKALLKQEYDDTIATINKEERDTLAKMDKVQKAGVKVTPEQRQQVKDNAKQQRVFAELQYMKESYDLQKDWQDKNLESWIDYNKEYGTYQEKRLAIAQEYAMKIAKAETEGERAKLGKDRDKELQVLGFEEFKKGIDFDKVFGNIDKLSTDMLIQLQSKLSEYKASLKIGVNISPESYKEIQDAVLGLEEKIADRAPIDQLKAGYDEYRQATNKVAQAEQELKDIQGGREVVVSWYMDKNGKLVKQLKTQEQVEKDLANAQNSRYAALTKITQSVNSIGEKGELVVTAGNDLVDTLTNLGVKVPESVKGTLEGLGQITSSLSSIDFTKPFSVVTGITGTLSGLSKSIGSIFGLGSDSEAKKYEALKEKYEGLLKIWDDLLDRKKEYLQISTADEANRVEKETLELIGKQEDAIRKLAEARLSVSNGSHSMWYRMWKGSYKFDGQNWRDVASDIEKQIKSAGLGNITFDSMDSLTKMTSEQLQWIKDNYSGLWSVMDDDFRGYLEQLIKYGDQAKEVIKQSQESLTQISFDNLRDSFLSTLMDMDSSAEDFADNFSSYMQKAILNKMLAKTYENRLQDWYNKFADANREGGIDKGEYNDLKSEWDKIVSDALKERDGLKDLFGWSASSSSSSQSGRAGAVNSITEGTGSELVGIGNNILDRMVSFAALLEELKKGREADSAIFAEKAENTAYCKMLEPLLETVQRWEASRFKVTM